MSGPTSRARCPVAPRTASAVASPRTGVAQDLERRGAQAGAGDLDHLDAGGAHAGQGLGRLGGHDDAPRLDQNEIDDRAADVLREGRLDDVVAVAFEPE